MKMKILSFAPKYYGKKRWQVMAIELCSKSQKCVNAAYKKVKIGTKATIEFPHSIPGIETLKFLKSKK